MFCTGRTPDEIYLRQCRIFIFLLLTMFTNSIVFNEAEIFSEQELGLITEMRNTTYFPHWIAQSGPQILIQKSNGSCQMILYYMDPNILSKGPFYTLE